MPWLARWNETKMSVRLVVSLVSNFYSCSGPPADPVPTDFSALLLTTEMSHGYFSSAVSILHVGSFKS